MTIALVDGDIVAYRSAASAEKEPESNIALIRAHRTLQDIASVTGANEVRVFLSGSTNFRKEIYPLYKANRDELKRPQYLQAVRECLVLEWGAEVTDGYEADDALGVEQGEDTIICTIDKDLAQVPGLHYNFVNGEFSAVDEIEGWRSFYKQLVLGDRGDNVPGYDGKMRLKFPKFLAEVREGLERSKTMAEMANVVRNLYRQAGTEETLERNGRLLYIWRVLNDQWSPPVETLSSEVKPEAGEKSESTPTTLVETFPSTVRGGGKPKKGGFPQRGTKKATRLQKKSRRALT